MSNTLTLDETIEVRRPLHEVFAYVSEFSRIEEWDPAVASAEKLTPGAPRIGTRFRIDMRAGFSLGYEIIEIEEDAGMLMTSIRGSSLRAKRSCLRRSRLVRDCATSPNSTFPGRSPHLIACSRV